MAEQIAGVTGSGTVTVSQAFLRGSSVVHPVCGGVVEVCARAHPAFLAMIGVPEAARRLSVQGDCGGCGVSAYFVVVGTVSEGEVQNAD